MKKTTTKGRARRIATHAGTGRTCGECGRGEWNDMYFDYQGKPFLIYCEHATYAYSPRVGKPSCLAITDACACFTAGEKGGAK